MTHVILRVHHDDARHIIRVGKGESATTLVERFQRDLRRVGHPTSVTWQVYEGSIVGALVASHAIC